MDTAWFMAMFLPMMSADQQRRRTPTTFTSVSVITGDEIVLRTTALPDRESRIAAYRKSPESYLLNLND
jgi:hypothetical protein